MTAPAHASIDIIPVATPGLGNRSYLVGHGEVAVVIDPPRDGWRIAAEARRRGWRVTHALETHVHNDYLTGALELRKAEQTTIVAPARGNYAFTHVAADEGSSVEVGNGGLIARATPGHTPEHLCWELQDGAGAPLALFSGGSLLIGGVGRTDLLGAGRTKEMTAAQFRTMRQLELLPPEVVVYPTHGAGSFCVAGEPDGPAVASIGALRRWNPAFASPDLEAFERELEAGRTRYPTYYRRMAPLNRRGPRIIGASPVPRALPAAAVAQARESGVWLIDVRDRWAFAECHIKGSLNVELGDSLAAYLGWLLPFDAPICFIVDAPEQEVEAAEELLRIGFDHVIGHLHGGMAGWLAAGGETSSYGTASWEELEGAAGGGASGSVGILDVRQPSEWASGVIPGSRRVFVADLPSAVAGLDRSKRWLVACRTGVRAAIAASILDAAGIAARPVSDGGVPSLPPSGLVAPDE